MDKNKILIIALIVIIVALVVGIVAIMPNMNKHDTNLVFKSNSTIIEGDSIKVQLTDVNGTKLENQTVNVVIINKDKSKEIIPVVTNSKGVASLKIDKSSGTYDVEFNYEGNDTYNGCNITEKLKVKEKVVEAEASSDNSYDDYSESSYSSSAEQTYPSGLTDAEIEAYIQNDLDIRAQNGIDSEYDYEGAREFYENCPPTGPV